MMPQITSPLAGKKRSQQLSAIVLALLALIALLAILAHGQSKPRVPRSLPSISMPTESAASHTSPASDGDGSADGDTVAYILLPTEAQNTITLIIRGGPFPYAHDGIVYLNRNRVLPIHPRGWYHEYTVVTPGASNRAMRRIVTGQDHTFYYTSDHYNTFKRVLR